MNHVRAFYRDVVAGRYNTAAFALVFGFVAFAMPGVAHASDPLASATSAATSVETSLKTFALAVGGIGMVCCLLLGFFGKLNWKWVATGVGVSFALATVVPVITWLNSIGTSG